MANEDGFNIFSDNNNEWKEREKDDGYYQEINIDDPLNNDVYPMNDDKEPIGDIENWGGVQPVMRNYNNNGIKKLDDNGSLNSVETEKGKPTKKKQIQNTQKQIPNNQKQPQGIQKKPMKDNKKPQKIDKPNISNDLSEFEFKPEEAETHSDPGFNMDDLFNQTKLDSKKTFQENNNQQDNSDALSVASGSTIKEVEYQKESESGFEEEVKETKEIHEESPRPKKDERKFESKDDEKLYYLLKLKALETRKKISLSKHYTLNSSIEELKVEYKNQMAYLKTESNISMMRNGIVMLAQGMEQITTIYNPLNAKFEGWGQHVVETSTEYDDIFEELSDKYGGENMIPPELKLLGLFSYNAFIFHATKNMFSKLGGGSLENEMKFRESVRQNPQAFENLKQLYMNNKPQPLGNPNVQVQQPPQFQNQVQNQFQNQVQNYAQNQFQNQVQNYAHPNINGSGVPSPDYKLNIENQNMMQFQPPSQFQNQNQFQPQIQPQFLSNPVSDLPFPSQTRDKKMDKEALDYEFRQKQMERDNEEDILMKIQKEELTGRKEIQIPRISSSKKGKPILEV